MLKKVWFALFLYISPVWAISFTDGFVAYEKNDFNTALHHFESMAKYGDATSQLMLGLMYAEGKGVSKDILKALYWLNEAKKQGFSADNIKKFIDAKLQSEITKYIDNTQNNQTDFTPNFEDAMQAFEEQNYDIAFKHFKPLAQQNNDYAKYAQAYLGFMYYYGYGRETDYQKSAYWFTQSAENGEPTAQELLADMYKNGTGVQQDYQLAVYWYEKSAEQGNKNAQKDLGYMYYEGKGVQQDYTLSAYWFEQSAEQGHASAQNWLGYMYDYGEGVEQDSIIAVYWYEKSAMQGHKYAQTNLGYMYEYGYGTAKNNILAYMWYDMARINNDSDATDYIHDITQYMSQSDIHTAQQLSQKCYNSNYQDCGY